LASAQARAELARLNLERAKELWERNAIAKSEFDATDAAFKSATADVASIQANIEKKLVRAPFAGRTGIRMVNLGQFLDRGNPIVTLQSLDPIHVDFSLPQQRLAEVRAGYEVRVTSDALPGRVFNGKVTAINPEIDASTRTFRVQATFANADESLSPGMFVNVQVVAPDKIDVVAVPATAVYFQAFGDSIFVAVEKKDEKSGQMVKRAEQRFVRLGEARGDFVVVESGVKAGEEVVTSGVFKLSNGTKLAIDNSLAPAASLAPKPKNT
jgi:membrane fusion protein (multidrug efflux system)